MSQTNAAAISSRRIAGLVIATATAALGIAVAQPAASAHAAEADCAAPGEFPSLGNVHNGTDSGVNVYAGGDYVATGDAAESEGLLVVGGNATFDTDKLFNLGTVGVGSGLTPEPRSEMLAVGGDVDIVDPTSVSIGALVPGFEPGGGNAASGGDISGSLDTNGGTAESSEPDALSDYSDFSANIATQSADLSSEDAVAGDVSGSDVTFVGDGTDDLQVFSISAEDLSGVTAVHFENVGGDSAPIAINVSGTNVDFAPNFFSVDGERSDFGDELGNASARVLWNFEDATDVALGGTSQMVGSILVPNESSSVDITASTNGRVYVGGDLTTEGTGNEQHAYPWIGAPLTSCSADDNGDSDDNDDSDRDDNDNSDGSEDNGGDDNSDGNNSSDGNDNSDETDSSNGNDGNDGPTASDGNDDPTASDGNDGPTASDGDSSDASDNGSNDASLSDSADEASNDETLPYTGAEIGLLWPLAALLLILVGGGTTLIARSRSRN